MPTKTTQGQATAPFPFRSTEVTRLDISGGIWNNVEGNSITLNNCKVFVNSDGQIPQTSPLFLSHQRSAKNIARMSCELGERKKASRPRNPPTIPTLTSPPLDCSMPAHFRAATITIKRIKELIAPHGDAIGVFKRIEPHLRDLETLVDFASTAYTACGSGTVLGNIVKAVINTQMEQCRDRLSQLLGQIQWLPYRFFPRIGFAYCLAHEWWTGNEPEEIRVIRLSLSEEVRAIGEWLCCLHSFWWASSQLLTTRSTFTMDNLQDFLESGPISMLRQIVIKEMIILEPLQGEPRSIPIRFVDTFEDVHLAIGMACQGTAASRFIENRQYQLDESNTDFTVSEGDILQRISKCQVFEVTIAFSRLEVLANVCPRCEKSHEDESQKNKNGWLKCHQCGVP
ncbi:hypothetical protein BKA70DRAFT_859685 [Coprinopsis sp. MPI-PUGE-AT-0042]|nr:hypothetical protein BKA70DRAFT_859685 [Coprinopsis sp. MPI-PUGE-AT-0042]